MSLGDLGVALSLGGWGLLGTGLLRLPRRPVTTHVIDPHASWGESLVRNEVLLWSESQDEVRRATKPKACALHADSSSSASKFTSLALQ